MRALIRSIERLALAFLIVLLLIFAATLAQGVGESVGGGIVERLVP